MSRGSFALHLLALLPAVGALQPKADSTFPAPMGFKAPAPMNFQFPAPLSFKREPMASFVLASKDICIEAPLSNADKVKQWLEGTTSKSMVKDVELAVDPCFSRNYTKVFSTLEPCHKQTTMWKYDPTIWEFQGIEGEERLAGYTKKVRKHQEAIFGQCFGKEEAESAMSLSETKAKAMDDAFTKQMVQKLHLKQKNKKHHLFGR